MINHTDYKNTVCNDVLSFDLAGVDTVSGNLCNILLLLAEQPEIKERLYQEFVRKFSEEITYEGLVENAYLDAFLKECLRLHNSILSLERTAMEDCKIGDFNIEKGTGVYLLIFIPHTHPGK